MATIVEKLADLEYNEIVTLGLIEKDTDLCDIFKEDINLPFSVLYRLSKDNELPENIKELVFNIFDKLIVTRKQYIEKYSKLLNEEPEIQETSIEPTQELPELAIAVETEPIKEVILKDTSAKKPNKSKTPRRYGVSKVLVDIENQGGKATNAQLTAIAVNELKNMYVNLNARLVKDMLLETTILDDEDYRDIRSTVKIAQNKLKNVLKKK